MGPFFSNLLKVLVELVLCAGLAGLSLLLVYVPKVQAMPLGFITLSAVAMVIFAVISLYGRFISFFEPPLGKRLVRLFVRKY
ncbi:MAG: hypothetical protein ACRCYY_19240 [Trueperaceae bacterium]